MYNTFVNSVVRQEGNKVFSDFEALVQGDPRGEGRCLRQACIALTKVSHVIENVVQFGSTNEKRIIHARDTIHSD